MGWSHFCDWPGLHLTFTGTACMYISTFLILVIHCLLDFFFSGIFTNVFFSELMYALQDLRLSQQ